MKNKIGRNDCCTCGSGRKYKKCCMFFNINSVQIKPYLDNKGINYIVPECSTSTELINAMTKSYRDEIRNSSLWNEMVKEYGVDQAEKLLKEFKVESKQI